jgi:hypothetical protein
MIPIQWTTEGNQKDLPDLIEKLKAEGGAIVEYRSVFSFIILSHMSSKLVWVPEERSHSFQGLVSSIPTLFLGWWSINGFFWTLGVVMSNILGGLDVSELFLVHPEDAELSAEIVSKIESQRKIQQYAFVGILLLVLILIIVFLVMPSLK